MRYLHERCLISAVWPIIDATFVTIYSPCWVVPRLGLFEHVSIQSRSPILLTHPLWGIEARLIGDRPRWQKKRKVWEFKSPISAPSALNLNLVIFGGASAPRGAAIMLADGEAPAGDVRATARQANGLPGPSRAARSNLLQRAHGPRLRYRGNILWRTSAVKNTLGADVRPNLQA